MHCERKQKIPTKSITFLLHVHPKVQRYAQVQPFETIGIIFVESKYFVRRLYESKSARFHIANESVIIKLCDFLEIKRKNSRLIFTKAKFQRKSVAYFEALLQDRGPSECKCITSELYF